MDIDDKAKVEVLPEYLLPPVTAPLVKRIPIKVNKKMQGLSLLQFPSKEGGLQSGIKAEVKKENKKLRLFMDLDKRGVVYNKAVDMDKIEYESRLMSCNTNYFVGAYRDGEVHLNQVQDIYQLRVNLNNLKSKKTEDVEDIEEEVKGAEPAVTSRFVGIQAQNAADKPSNSSIQSILRKDQDENFLGYGWREFDSAESNKQFEKMFTDTPNKLKNTTKSRDLLG